MAPAFSPAIAWAGLDERRADIDVLRPQMQFMPKRLMAFDAASFARPPGDPMARLPARLSLPLACALAASLAAVSAPASAAGAARDLQATRAYYQRLVAAPPRLAELELLMTMLPKGGDLHHHYTGAIYAETYLDWVGRQGFCVYRATLRIETQPPATAGTPGNECLGADAVRQDAAVYRGLLQRWSDKDFDNHSHDQPPPDQQFFDTFGYFGPAAGFSPRTGLALLKQRAKDENVQYLETMLRGAPAVPVPPAGAALDALAPDADAGAVDAVLATAFGQMEADATIGPAISAYRDQLADAVQGIDDATFTLRLQTYVSRNNKPSQVFAGLYAAFRTAHDNPLVVGVNIVGPENGIVAMRDYALHMRMFHFLAQRFPATRLALHAGELVLGMVPPEGLRNHIAQAVRVAGASRIGHGIDVVHETDALGLMAEMRRRDIAVEINLTSNDFILGVSGASHPVTVYLQHGVPIVISTDDAGVSRSSLSHEYLLFVSRYRPGYDELKRVVRSSLAHAFLPDAEKAAQLRELDRRFAAFEAAVAGMATAARPGR
jgi:adenosine deaminase/adenosine deaminase CECR1